MRGGTRGMRAASVQRASDARAVSGGARESKSLKLVQGVCLVLKSWSEPALYANSNKTDAR